MHRASRRAVAFTLAVATAATACTGDDDATTPPSTTSTATPPVTEPERPSDGVLKIGVLLPRTGAGAQLGRPMIEAVDTAVSGINNSSSGGVLGDDVVVVKVDEGDTVTSAASGFDALIRAGVDAIVGPASSLAALAGLDAPVAAGVVTCSPTATALALDEYPDDGLFFRTVPSDSLQALAIARAAQGTGTRAVAIGHLDDPYGRGLAEAVSAAVSAEGLDLAETVAFASDEEDLTDEATALLDGAPGVVVVLGDAADGSRLVAALAEALEGSDVLPEIIVNDAMRNPASQPVMRNLPNEIREHVTGLAPSATSNDDTLDGPYAANAYDCVNLIALAAVQAGSDASADIAAQMTSVSTSGFACRSFDVCIQQLGDREIDYDGPSGNLSLSNRTGDPTTGRFERFAFDDEGQDEAVGWLDVDVD